MKRLAALAALAVAAATLAFASGDRSGDRGLIPMFVTTETRGDTKIVAFRATATVDTSYTLTVEEEMDLVQALVSTRSNPDTLADGSFVVSRADGGRFLELSVATNTGTHTIDFARTIRLREGDRVIFFSEGGEPGSGRLTLIGSPVAAPVAEAFTVK